MTKDEGAENLHQGVSAYRKTLCDKIRRERIATACLQGLLSGEVVHEKCVKPRIVYLRAAEDAVTYADALIAELDREDVG